LYSSRFRDYDTRANDVWALGVIILEMVNGYSPWKRPTDSLPNSIFYAKDHKARSDILYKAFPKISSDLADVLADVFKPESRRLTGRELAGKLATIRSFISSQRHRRDAVPRDVMNGLIPDSHVCVGGGVGNETMAVA
jgi:serine/threonine protein kinase